MKNRILILEDSTDLRLLYAQVLRSRGFETLLPNSALEALQSLREEPIPALILLDLSMPDMSGEQFIDILRAETRWQQIPVILISGRDDLDFYVKQLKANGGLQKPIELRVLQQVIESFLPADFPRSPQRTPKELTPAPRL